MPPGATFQISLLPVSATYTLPAASTAEAPGPRKLAPTVVWVPVLKVICGPCPIPWIYAVARTLPDVSSRMTAPIRRPGAMGENVTSTVHVL